jgi:hypothetical protein
VKAKVTTKHNLKKQAKARETLKPQTLETRKQRIEDEVKKNTSKAQTEGIKYGIDSKYAQLEAELA